MHELGITQGIVDRAREAAQRDGARVVTEVHIVMTPAADFTEESVRMYFEMLTQDDDLFRGATLHVEHAAAGATCAECGAQFEAQAPEPACAGCGSQNVRFDPEAPMIQLTEVVVDEE